MTSAMTQLGLTWKDDVAVMSAGTCRRMRAHVGMWDVGRRMAELTENVTGAWGCMECWMVTGPASLSRSFNDLHAYMICVLGCVCFGWKSLPEMLFRKWGCLVGLKNSIFRKLKSVDPNKKPLTTEIILHFYFPFKVFLENERETERERARAHDRDLGSRSSDWSSRDRCGLELGVRRRSSDWLECFFSSRARACALSLSLSLSLSHFPEILWRENRSVKRFLWSKAFFFGQRISISGK